MRIALLVVAILVAVPAAAQTVYRFVRPDGRIVYSDTPVPGARLDGTVAPPAPAGAPPPAPVESRGAAASDAGQERTRRLRTATEEVSSATQSLEQARAQLAAGREPLPGERTGTASGGSRLNETYEARQAFNEEQVAKAQARLDRAVAERNAAR